MSISFDRLGASSPGTQARIEIGIVPTSLAPREGVQVYTVDDLYHIVNEPGGHPVRVEPRHPDGHSKVVVTEQLTNVLFRGFFTRSSDVNTPVDGEFVYLKAPGSAGGDFENYSDSSPVGFRPGYNPFAFGEPWHTAPVGGNVDYVGNLVYRGSAFDEAEMERFATSTGEAYVLLHEEQVVFVDEYTAPSAGETVFFGVSLIPRYYNNPSLVLWGTEQDHRVDDDRTSNIERSTVGGGVAHLKWKLDDSELFFGATADMVEILAAADVPTTTEFYNNLTAARRGNIWFKLHPGIWSFEGGAHFINTATYTEAFLRIVTSGPRDRVLSTSSSGAYNESQTAIGTPYVPGGLIFSAPLIRVAEDDVYYVLMDRANETTTSTSQWLKATYHGSE